MDRKQIAEIKRALSTLEKYLAIVEYLPSDITERAKACLARFSAFSSNGNSAKGIAPSTTSGEGDESTPDAGAALIRQSASLTQSQTSKRPASYSGSPGDGIGRDSSKKRKGKTNLQNDETIDETYKIFKKHAVRTLGLIESCAASVGVADTWTACHHDPREDDIDRCKAPTPIQSLRRLLAMRSLSNAVEKRLEKNETYTYKCLAGELKVSTKTIDHSRQYGKKSQEFADEYGSSGILWFLVFCLGNWRYLAKNEISKVVKRMKEDNDLEEIMVSYSTHWDSAETTYEFAVHYRMSLHLMIVKFALAQPQSKIQEVDDSEDDSGSQVSDQTREIQDHTPQCQES